MDATLFVALVAAALHDHDRQEDNQQAATDANQNPLPVIEASMLIPRVHSLRQKLISHIRHRNYIVSNVDLCGLADGAAWPIKTAINKFRGEFEEYIKSGRRSESPVLAGAH